MTLARREALDAATKLRALRPPPQPEARLGAASHPPI